jgi:hypothetical protein
MAPGLVESDLLVATPTRDAPEQNVADLGDVLPIDDQTGGFRVQKLGGDIESRAAAIDDIAAGEARRIVILPPGVRCI